MHLGGRRGIWNVPYVTSVYLMTRATALTMLKGFESASETGPDSVVNANAWTVEAFRALYLRESKVCMRHTRAHFGSVARSFSWPTELAGLD